MRLFWIAILALAACSPPPAPSQQPVAVGESGPGCTRAALKRVAFSDPSQSTDIVTAESKGPTCAQAVVTLTIRDAAGDPLWVHAETFAAMEGGGARPASMPAAVAADLDRFLASWADVTLKRTGDLPPWREGAATLGDSVTGMSYATPFDRLTYERLREQNVPDLCFAAGAESSQCIVMDPASHTPSLMVSFGA